VLSDIHGGSNGVTEEKLQEIVAATNREEPDLIVILGDFVSQSRGGKPVRQRSLKMPIGVIADNLRGLNARYGVFAVLGNHDGWFGDEEVGSELRRVGFMVLENQVAVIETEGHRFRILGLRDHYEMTDPKSFDAEVEAALASSGDGDIIVLEHSPDLFPILMEKKPPISDFKLMLAGHTHGGQICLPILGAPIVPSNYGQRYARGHIRESGKDLFVTTGIGTSILPLRFLAPPEIAVVSIYTA
jgi:predicted MPP superfamily phosphohydrolase